MTYAHDCILKDLNPLHKFVFAFIFFILYAQILFGSDAHKKSLFLENITPFITWPENNKPNFTICVLNDSVLMNSLQMLYAGKTFNKKPVLISNHNQNDTPDLCDILFIGKKTDQINKLTQTLLNKPMLTVSDRKSLINEGVMITMFEDNDRIACTINHKAAQQSNIRVSYLLLESAYEVIK